MTDEKPATLFSKTKRATRRGIGIINSDGHVYVRPAAAPLVVSLALPVKGTGWTAYVCWAALSGLVSMGVFGPRALPWAIVNRPVGADKGSARRGW